MTASRSWTTVPVKYRILPQQKYIFSRYAIINFNKSYFYHLSSRRGLFVFHSLDISFLIITAVESNMTSKTTSKDVDTQSTPQCVIFFSTCISVALSRSVSYIGKDHPPLPCEIHISVDYEGSIVLILLRNLTRMFALIIGISKYPNTGSLRNLPGVDTDISSMKDFLAMSRVSKILQNEKATASGISDALRAIINDKNIGREDPILIYFAGHGVKVNLTSEDKAMSTTRMLCPYDFVQQTRSAPSSNGISDAALSNFLADISSQKGNNIVSILNSCPRTCITNPFCTKRQLYWIVVTPDMQYRALLRSVINEIHPRWPRGVARSEHSMTNWSQFLNIWVYPPTSCSLVAVWRKLVSKSQREVPTRMP